MFVRTHCRQNPGNYGQNKCVSIFRNILYIPMTLCLGLCPIRVTLVWRFWLSTRLSFGMIFLGFRLKCLLDKLFESTQDSSSISVWFISIQLMNQATSREIDSESTHDSGGSQGTDSDRLMARANAPGIKSDWLVTQNASHFPIQIDSWLRRKTFDSVSTHDSTWVISMSGAELCCSDAKCTDIAEDQTLSNYTVIPC